MREEEAGERNWLDVVRAAEEDICLLPRGQSYALYKIVYLAFRRLAPVDSFYVCLYVPHDALPLWFPYNVDGADEWDEPARLPLKGMGEGPTSTVVHTRRPFVLDSGNEAVHVGGVAFGHMERVSLSAVHVPILSEAGTSRERLHGVVSAQSYQPDAYPRQAVRALEMLADHLGTWMRREEDPEGTEISTRPATTRPAIAVADAFVEMVRGLRTTAEELARQVPAENPALQRLAEQMCEECRRVQVEALQLPLRAGLHVPEAAPTPDVPTGSETGALGTLTRTERRVLERLRHGETDAVIARHLHMQESTVKFHLRNIYHKLDVENRLQAVQVLRDAAR